ncbi:hypothetical protein RB195_016338 [Necator americanus]|uniref:Uncharacterized protein n=2 Tax=Necator americanus TaxID=51031 RepID=A0ABR1E8N7_NECAM
MGCKSCICSQRRRVPWRNTTTPHPKLDCLVPVWSCNALRMTRSISIFATQAQPKPLSPLSLLFADSQLSQNMGSAGIAIGPDGKPLKRQEKRNQVPRGGITKPGMKRGGMPMRPMRGGMPGPLMGGPGFGPGPFGPGFGPGMRGPMPYGGPSHNMGFGPGDQNVSFFKGPQPPVPMGMGDARTGPMQSGPAMTPSATTVGRGAVGGGGFGTGGADAPNGTATNSANEVPGFGTNSSIHELFGKMVWKKMEGLRDENVIDRLQNRIMNMIHEALAEQSGGNSSNQVSTTNGRQVGGFRSF